MKTTKLIQIHNLTTDETNAGLMEFIEGTGMGDISEVMVGDPDILNIKGNRIHFVEFDTADNKWIVYLDTGSGIDRNKIEKILLSFFSDTWEQDFQLRERSWSQFKHNCIAYRGSQGVFYEIWKYKPGYKKNIIPGSHPYNGQPAEIRNLKVNRSKGRKGKPSELTGFDQLPGKGNESFFTVSQGQAPRGFGENHPRFAPVFSPKNLTYLKDSPLHARQLVKPSGSIV